jgi:hypothetical protein
MPLTVHVNLSKGPLVLAETVAKVLATADAAPLNETFYTTMDIHEAINKTVCDQKFLHPKIEFAHDLINPAEAKEFRETIIHDFKLDQDKVNLGLALTLLRGELDIYDLKMAIVFLELGANENIFNILNIGLAIKNKILNDAFVRRFPVAIQKLHACGARIENVETQGWRFTIRRPLIHYILFEMQDPAWWGIAIHDDVGFATRHNTYPATHCLHKLHNHSHEQYKRVIRFLAKPQLELPRSQIAGLALNTTVNAENETPLSVAVETRNVRAVHALIECAEEMKLPLFPHNRSIWNMTICSNRLEGSLEADEMTSAIIQYSLRFNQTKLPEERVDVVGLRPAAGPLSELPPAYFADRAITHSWLQTFKLAMQLHPEWIQAGNNITLIHVAINAMHFGNNASYEILMLLIKMGANLDEAHNDRVAAERLDLHGAVRDPHLRELPYEMAASRLLLKDGKAQELKHLDRAFRRYGARNHFFRHLRDKSENICLNSYLACYAMCKKMIDEFAKRSSRGQFISGEILCLIFSFHHIFVFSLNPEEMKQKEKDDAKQVIKNSAIKKQMEKEGKKFQPMTIPDIKYSVQLHADFMKHRIRPIVQRCVAECYARFLNKSSAHRDKKQEVTAAVPVSSAAQKSKQEREIFRAKRHR